jgi:glycerol-3-phosphate dehydrogenase
MSGASRVPAPPAPAFQPGGRGENLIRLAQAPLDVLIIGGGINGAGVARDLALRAQSAGKPLRIGLVEKGQFSEGTSGRNSQLIHGGLRYLENFEFGLVREALRERSALLNIAPHLVEPLAFLLPFRSWFARRYYGIGLWLYDVLAGSHNIGGGRRFLSRAELAQAAPQLMGGRLHSAGIYHDCKVNSARVVLENIFDAARAGAICVNYARALQPEGESVELADEIGGGRIAVTARRIVDARGPWDDSTELRLVRGSHIILPALTNGGHAIAHFHTDGRIIFVIPWGPANSLSLVGTTDVDHSNSPDRVKISAEEIRYLLAVVRELFPTAPDVPPIAAYSSLRPLVKVPGQSATKTSREHKIFADDRGTVRITGGKYTTYRVMSAEAADLAAPELAGRAITAETPLGGNSPEAYAAERSRIDDRARRHELSRTEMELLTAHYGRQIESILSYLPEPGPPAVPTRAERAAIAYAARHEMAQRLTDLLFVSTYWGHERSWTRLDLDRYARELGRHLGWDDARREREIDAALQATAVPNYQTC